MSFEIVNVAQGSDAWKLERLGRLTGSMAGAMLSKPRSKTAKESDGRRDLRVRLALERLTGKPKGDSYVSYAMQKGIEGEAAAVAYYEAVMGVVVRRTGFLRHTELMTGCSLDGDIDNFRGLLEVKCQEEAIHWEMIQTSNVPPGYDAQNRHGLWITNAEFLDFVSFNESFPPELRLARVRYLRAHAEIPAYEHEARRFLLEVDRAVDEMREQARGAA